MPQSDSPPVPAPTRPERIDFLRQMVAFTEGNIRSYDTKAQISVAAFVLSFPPYWFMASAVCGRLGWQPMAAATLLVYFGTILAFFHVLWPVTPAAGEANAKPGIFFIHDPRQLAGASLLERLQSLDSERELAAEALKLAHIRNAKSRRLKAALVGAFLFYVLAYATYVVSRGCN